MSAEVIAGLVFLVLVVAWLALALIDRRVRKLRVGFFLERERTDDRRDANGDG